ncbi:hypothetical protein [Shewanella donghaensis]|uniref:hypothetical protein n=1 Tax=Shewanella donghaensis TaxID=238836 RepID=UPI0011828564|nr:hypothetical protein [Shewanella donghaensis]
MNNRQFYFNVSVGLMLSGLGWIILQIDAAGGALLTVGLMLTCLSIAPIFKSMLLKNRKGNTVLSPLTMPETAASFGDVKCK